MTRKIKLAICLAASLGLSAAMLDGAVVHLTSAQPLRASAQALRVSAQALRASAQPLRASAQPRRASAQPRRVDFRRDIEPILRANCYQCDGAKKASAQLRLDDQELPMKGGISGAVIVQIGRASCRERVEIAEGAVRWKKEEDK